MYNFAIACFSYTYFFSFPVFGLIEFVIIIYLFIAY